MNIGYARVSSVGQNLDSQMDDLALENCDKIFAEKKSGKSSKDRDQLLQAIDFVREGDTLVVTRLDRLARSVTDLYKIISRLNDKKVTLKVIHQDFNTEEPMGRLMIGLLALIAEFETDLRAERQADGIKSALDRGVKFGAKEKITDEEVVIAIQLKAEGKTGEEVAKQFGVSRSSLLRRIKQHNEGRTND